MEREDGKPVGVWIRVSTEDQAKGDSPDIHRKRAEQYAELKGWKVVEIYDLSAVSGKAVMEHPEAARMLEDVRTGRISGLVFSKLARLARNTKELLEFSEIFRAHDADLISLHESIDTSTPAGRLFYTMIAAMAQWEREEIADRVRAAVLTRAKLGRQVGGAAPFGYHWVDGVLTPHPEEAPVRRLMYELFAEYQRKGTVARILNERGYRTRRGKEFALQTIGHILQDPTAKGLRRSNYTRVEKRGASVKFKPEDEWEWHECEAVVPVELWEQCNAILEKQRKGRSPGPRGRYLFAGKVRCERDGQTMYVLNESPKFVCRKCRAKIPQADLEAIFRDQLQAFFSSRDELQAHLEASAAEIVQKEEQLSVLRQERSRIDADRKKVLRSYLDDVMDVSRFKDLDREAGDRLSSIDAETGALEGEISALKIAGDSSEEVIANAKDLYGRWDDLPIDERKSIIDTIVDEIVVGERDISIKLLYVPFTPDDGNYMQNTLSL